MQYAWLLLLPAGTAVYIGLQKWYTGHALAFLTAQKNWGRSFFSLNEEHMALVSEASTANFALDVLFALLLLAGVVLVIKKLHVGYGLYVLVACMVPLLTGTLMSIGRFGMVLFPYYLALAKVQNPWPKRVWLFTSTALLMLYTIQFVHGYWAG